MQFQVPQFIETEDKIVGPFSLKQFIYAGSGIATSALFYFILNFWVWLPLAAIVTLAGMACAFVKINGRQLPFIARSAFQYFWKPRVYVWQSTPLPSSKEERSSQPQEGGTKKFSLENILGGFALANTWQKVQTGTIESKQKAERSFSRLKEQYQVFGKITGERAAARRLDYR